MVSTSTNLKEAYNSLPTLEEADRQRAANDRFDDFLDEAGQIFVDANVVEIAAVRLLHKHNDIADREMMFEEFEVLPHGKEALVTRRVSTDRAANAVPHIWKCLPGGQVEALEFTAEIDDDFDAESFVAEKRGFFEAFDALTRKWGLENIIGISLKQDRLRAAEDELVLEFVDGRAVTNTVMVERRTNHAPELIVPTTWEFDHDVIGNCLKKYCQAACLKEPKTHEHNVGHQGVHGMDQ